ncbi:heme NO-binding domain-containing protein [Marinobacterium mangrovicola]|uniref:Heme-NO-binding protein n=1 Tax=Marinobacterium mangrovicola TaxID=1476959 RepID=A0A4R1GBQ0_9GAMM|nr:heme NO-binding domain-containing protein [Marinobacterium mangrovicola]TCK05637.1 heme-NO-binding protein [Marinobacterium mangrovicola]
MLGVVYTSFIEMVEEKFSPEVADQLLENPQLQYGGIYTAVGSYEHHDIIRMAVHLSEISGIPADDLVPVFGEYLFHQLVERYPQMVDGCDNLLDFLQGIETSVHTQVRALYPSAQLPRFECIREDSNHLTMHYESKRPFVNLARGLIQGAANYFGQDYQVEVIRSRETADNKASFYITTTI